ncbi:MAG: phosphatase PAP2 family protein [Ilumatobacteraceae bacterium]
MTSTGAMHDVPPTGVPAAPASLDGPVPGGTDDRSRKAELTDVSLRWSDLGMFLACYAGLVAVWFAIGKIVVGSSSINSLDQRVADWFVEQRTADLDLASEWGSGLADTFVKIGVTALIAIAMWLAWKRWREPLMMVVPLVLEASAFITVTYLIARPRPDDQLESSPVNSSFPSGHVAAAAAYSALVIIVFWHTRKVWARALVIVVSVAIPVVVALSRMYRGMHFLSDVIGGAALGVASVALSWWLIHRAIARNEPTTDVLPPPSTDATSAHAA